MDRHIALIDLGNSGARLIIARKEKHPAPKIVFSEGIHHTLTECIEDGCLTKEGTDSLHKIINRFLVHTGNYQIKKPLLYGVSFLKKVANFAEVLQKYEGWLEIHLLSDEEESAASFLGTLYRSGKLLTHGEEYGLLVQGAKKTELTIGTLEPFGVKISYNLSFPLAQVPADLLNPAVVKPADFHQQILLILKRLIPLGELAPFNPAKVFVLGKSAKKFYTFLQYIQGKNWDEAQLQFQGTSLRHQDLALLEKTLISPPLPKKELPATFNDRELLLSQTIYQKILSVLKNDELFISTWGLRYGLLLKILGYRIS